MSDPIRYCDYPLALDNEFYFDVLVDKCMQPIYSILPCQCDPPCRILTDNEKNALTEKVNARIKYIRGIGRKKKYEDENAARTPMTLEDMCGFIAHYLNKKTGHIMTPQDVFNLSPTYNMGFYLELYEEAIFSEGHDFYNRSALTYFDERYLMTVDDPALKVLATRYLNAFEKLSKNIDHG